VKKGNTLKLERKPVVKKHRPNHHKKSRRRNKEKAKLLNLKLWEDQWHKHPGRNDCKVEKRGLEKPK